MSRQKSLKRIVFKRIFLLKCHDKYFKINKNKQQEIKLVYVSHVVSKLNKYKNDFNRSEVILNIYTVVLHSKGTPTCPHVKYFHI